MNGRKKYTKEQLSKIIKDFYLQNNRVPKQRDFIGVKGSDLPSVKQFTDTWGSWSVMLLDLGLVTDTKRPINKKNIHTCAYCGRKFNAYGKRKYCSLECKTEGSRKYESTSNSTNVSGYRRIAFKNYDWKCAVCGYDKDINYTKGTKTLKFPVILDVHHLDFDRTNNDVANLVILCPTCHAKVHRNIITLTRGLFKKVKVSYNDEFGGYYEPPNTMYDKLK